MVREKRGRQQASPQASGSIWDTPRIKKILAEPVGTPIELTREEAMAIARDSAGSMPYLPDGADYVNKVRGIWGGVAKNLDG
jgi:hypothetical protein